jgi:hypothetical protein
LRREERGRRWSPGAFGLGLLTDMSLPGAWQARSLGDEPTLTLTTATPAQIAERWSGFDVLGWEGTVDGAPLIVQCGRVGDYRFVHGARPDNRGAFRAGTRAVHHLSADASELACAVADASDPLWWRLVLDSALFTIALIHGYEALHAAAVVTPQEDGAIAITAPMGGGKSTLLSELLRWGLPLMADDVVMLERSGAGTAPLAHPAPPLVTIPSVRLSALAGVGASARGTVGAAAGAASEASAGGSPESICVVGEESWVAVPAHPEPLPLRSLVVLERKCGAELSLMPIESALAPLLGSLMRFPSTRARERARFELASEMAGSVGIWRLTADLDTPPEALAEALLGGCLREVLVA